VIKRDKNGVFRFAALQSEIGKELALEFNIDTSQSDSIILIDNEKCYIKSSAALHISKQLSGGYPLLFGFMIIPTFIRNWVYDFVARNRYQWYGKRESCMVPTKKMKEKFLS